MKQFIKNSIAFACVTITFLIIVNITEGFSQSINYTKIFEEKFVFKSPSSYVENLMVNSTLVKVIYESPTTVVFEGKLIENIEYNKGIWQAMDFLQGAGFQVLDIMKTGDGTKDNPNIIFVTMSK